MNNRQRIKLLKQAYNYLQHYRVAPPELFVYDRREVYRFPNDWGASVIQGDGAHGLEVAVIMWFDEPVVHFELDPATYICRDPLGYLDENGLREVLVRIYNLGGPK